LNDYTTYTDSDLLILLKEEKKISDKAFKVLWYRYSKKLKNYCNFCTKCKEDSEDLFQNTWHKFYEVILTEKKINSILSYLIKIAHNIYLKKIEEEKLNLVYIDSFKLDDFIDNNKNFLENFEYQEILTQFKLSLNYLESDSKDRLLLYWVGGLSFTEISELYNESYDNSRMKCTRAMQKVLKLLKPNFKNII
jgi:RNA polymerase sigma-70 factor (ECF subfamily)